MTAPPAAAVAVGRGGDSDSDADEEPLDMGADIDMEFRKRMLTVSDVDVFPWAVVPVTAMNTRLFGSIPDATLDPRCAILASPLLVPGEPASIVPSWLTLPRGSSSSSSSSF